MAAIYKTVMTIKKGKMEESYKIFDSKSQMLSGIDGLMGFLIVQTGRLTTEVQTACNCCHD